MELMKLAGKLERNQIGPSGEKLTELYECGTKLLERHACTLGRGQMLKIFGDKAVNDKAAEFSASDEGVKTVSGENPENCL